MKHSTRRKPDAVIRTPFSDIRIFVQYEQDPEKSQQAWDEINRGLRYIAKSDGWIDVLEERDKAVQKIQSLAAKSQHNDVCE